MCVCACVCVCGAEVIGEERYRRKVIGEDEVKVKPVWWESDSVGRMAYGRVGPTEKVRHHRKAVIV